MSKKYTLFDYFNILIMIVLCVSIIYPLWYCVVYSFNDGLDAMQGNIYLWPRMFTFDNYKTVFSNKEIVTAFGITTARTVLTTSVHVLFTSMIAYALTKKITGRKVYLVIGTITMFFSGGLIPAFMLIKGLGLYDNFLVYVIPGIFSFYNLIIFQAFFRELPPGLEESAKIDGANDLLVFIRIILPLSLPVIATIALFVGVANWNDYFTGVMFTSKKELQPIQTFLYKIISESGSQGVIANTPMEVANTKRVTSQSIKYATMIITTLPIICVYPFLQKYFVKGMLLGSIKG